MSYPRAGITISDRERDGRRLSFDLADLATILPLFSTAYEWEVRDVECVGPAAEVLHEAAETGKRVSGPELRYLATQIAQMVDGELLCFRGGTTRVEAEIRAVDSAAFDVLSDRPEILALVRSHFRETRDLEE
jgi:hypothetical protein